MVRRRLISPLLVTRASINFSLGSALLRHATHAESLPNNNALPKPTAWLSITIGGCKVPLLLAKTTRTVPLPSPALK
jgi:hypothetical protein